MDLFLITFQTAGIQTWLFIPPMVAFAISFFTSMAGISGAFLLLRAHGSARLPVGWNCQWHLRYWGWCHYRPLPGDHFAFAHIHCRRCCIGGQFYDIPCRNGILQHGAPCRRRCVTTGFYSGLAVRHRRAKRYVHRSQMSEPFTRSYDQTDSAGYNSHGFCEIHPPIFLTERMAIIISMNPKFREYLHG